MLKKAVLELLKKKQGVLFKKSRKLLLIMCTKYTKNLM